MKRILAAMMFTALLLASCNVADTTESSEPSVETIVTESSESTPESSTSETSEASETSEESEVSEESEEVSETVSISSSEVSETESSVSESEPEESSDQTQTFKSPFSSTVHTGDIDFRSIPDDHKKWVYNSTFTAIPFELQGYVGKSKDIDEWAQSYDWQISLQAFIEDFGLTADEINQVLFNQETQFPVEVTPEEIDILCSGDQAAINRAFVSEYAALSETGDIYTIFWLGEHTAEDYKSAGLTADAIASAIENCQTLGIEAVDAYCTQAQTALATFEAEQ